MNHVKMWLSEDTPIESQAYDQIKAMAQLSILAGHIAIMPDVHLGQRRDGRQCDPDPRSHRAGFGWGRYWLWDGGSSNDDARRTVAGQLERMASRD